MNATDTYRNLFTAIQSGVERNCLKEGWRAKPLGYDLNVMCPSYWRHFYGVLWLERSLCNSCPLLFRLRFSRPAYNLSIDTAANLPAQATSDSSVCIAEWCVSDSIIFAAVFWIRSSDAISVPSLPSYIWI